MDTTLHLSKHNKVIIKQITDENIDENREKYYIIDRGNTYNLEPDNTWSRNKHIWYKIEEIDWTIEDTVRSIIDHLSIHSESKKINIGDYICIEWNCFEYIKKDE